MLRNYIAAALRNLVRNKLYAAINVVGLTVGFAAALLIGLFVRDELTYDRWIPGYENVYRLAKTFNPPGGKSDRLGSTSAAEPLWFRDELPQVVAVARLWPEVRGVRRAAVESNETVVWTDPEFFQVFPLESREGDIASALAAPDTVVITRTIARKYFGRDSAIGEIIEIDRKHSMRVAAVLKDPPSRSHLNLGILASRLSAISPLVPAPPQNGGAFEVMSYLRLTPGGFDALQAELTPFIDRHIPPIAAGTFRPNDGPLKWGADRIMTYDLQPLADLHMLRGYVERIHHGVLRPAGDRGMADALLVTGGLILLVAIANFINLMTARAGRRAVEVGVRKVSGALRMHLTAQFLGESFLYVAGSLAAAAALIWALLPAFSAFLDRALESGALGPEGAIFVAAVAIVTTLLGGIYPALVMSAYRPTAALKPASAMSGGSGLFRQILVVAQFAILVGLIVTTVVIARQTVFALKSGLVCEPKLILADEPTGNLDTANGEAVMQMLEQCVGNDTTVIMVTHSEAFAARAHRCIHLLDGRIVDSIAAAA